MSKRISIRNIKFIASSFFVSIGLINFIDTLINLPNHYLRDIIILLILSSPILINKRFYYLFFGFVASIISIVVLMVYAIHKTPSQIDISISFYLLGILLYLSALICSLTLVYVGTYSEEQKRFRLI